MRFGVVLAGGAAAVVVGALAYGYASDRASLVPEAILEPPSGAAFSEGRTLADGPNRGMFSPDGRNVAVLDRNAVALAVGGSVQPFTPSSGRIVDFAWMPDSASVLVAEGPIPTGQVSVITLEGKVTGTARLDPSIGFGSGYGMSVDSRGTRAAVIAVERDAIGGVERTDLAVIDLATGAVTRFSTSDRNERAPAFVDDDTVAVFEASAGKSADPRITLVDLATAKRRSLAAHSPISVVGTTNDGEVVVAERLGERERVVAIAVDGSRRSVLTVLEDGRRAVASDPRALRLLVVESVEVKASSGGTQTVARLSAVDIERPSAGG